MPRLRIDELLKLMNRAFSGGEHSLMDNLATVQESSWAVVPPGGSRSIRDIAHHVGMFKYMYANHGFADAVMDYDAPPATPAQARLATLESAAAWLREAHQYLAARVAELPDDSELDAPRKTHWGGFVPTRLLILTMIEHDLYHAGEINRSRALLQNDDAWFVPDPPPETPRPYG